MSTICRATNCLDFHHFGAARLYDAGHFWRCKLLSRDYSGPPVCWTRQSREKMCFFLVFFLEGGTFAAQDRVDWRLLTISDATTCVAGTAFTHLFRGRAYGRIWCIHANLVTKMENKHRIFGVIYHYKIGSSERNWSYLKLGLMLAEPPSTVCSLDMRTWCIRQLFFRVKFLISHLQICGLL